jgi:regulator of CtrA degradation
MASRSYSHTEQTVSFAERLARSSSFQALFQEGMALVEKSAGYLDGPGRQESKLLDRPIALAYATESMRLTTRLMQLASWLLLQRAVNEGEMSRAQAATEKHKVKLSRQDTATAPETFAALPERLRELIEHSMKLQDQVLRLDALLYGEVEPVIPSIAPTPVERQLQMLRRAFAQG